MEDAVLKYKQRRDARMKKRADAFEEGKHKRDEHGRFVSGGGSSTEAKGRAERDALFKKVKGGEKMTHKEFLDALGDKEMRKFMDEEAAKSVHEKLSRGERPGGEKKSPAKKMRSMEELKKQYDYDMSHDKKLHMTQDEIYELSKDPKMRKRMHNELFSDDEY